MREEGYAGRLCCSSRIYSGWRMVEECLGEQRGGEKKKTIKKKQREERQVGVKVVRYL